MPPEQVQALSTMLQAVNLLVPMTRHEIIIDHFVDELKRIFALASNKAEKGSQDQKMTCLRQKVISTYRKLPHLRRSRLRICLHVVNHLLQDTPMGTEKKVKLQIALRCVLFLFNLEDES